MRTRFNIKEISKEQALWMICKYHYSNTLAQKNRFYLGFFLENELVGVVTLGWGVRPRHTIQCLFPSLNSHDYLEIGRMAMTEEMPRNSESQMLSQMIAWVKHNHPEVKVILTWADGMQGKVGYVYQASNFIYTGKIVGEFYLKDGIKIHVRQMKGILIPKGQRDTRKTVRPTLEQMKEHNIRHYKGSQYRYIYFTCDKKEQQRLMQECMVDLPIPRPKDDDLKWRVRDLDGGVWMDCEKPVYKTDFDRQSKDEVMGAYKQLSLFEHMEGK